MSFPSTFEVVITLGILVLQWFVVQTDTLCGLSGADSIIRALGASIDGSAAFLFLAGTYTFSRKPASINQKAPDFLKRWSKLHSHPNENIKPGININIRSRSFLRFTTDSMTGFVQVSKQSDARNISTPQTSASPMPTQYQDQNLVENYAAFIVPYLIRKNKKITGNTTVRLEQEAVRGAAALTVARFASFAAWSFLFWLVRIGFLIYLTRGHWQMPLYLISETSRAILVFCQILSVQTYSLQYKGISSWATPPAEGGGSRSGRTGPYWEFDTMTQRNFETSVIQKIGNNIPALILFLTVRWAWPHLPGWLQHTRYCGPTIFSKFADAPPAAYTDQTSRKVKLNIFKGHETDTRDRQPIKVIEFTDVPGIIPTEMESSLSGGTIYRWVVGIVGAFLFTTVVAPCIFVLSHPSSGLKIYFALEQLVVLCLKFDDFEDMSINTMFQTEENHSEWTSVV